jgi:pimeloyl-ACP methyl ester carboxylesterase
VTVEATTGIETGTVGVDGIEVFFRRRGGEGYPAVFLHGNPTHSEDWMPVLERMNGPALAIDLPGFGRSERPDPSRFEYSMYSYALFLESALRELGVREHSLVVHDWGGLGLISAQRRPQLIRRIVVINAVPLLPGYRWHRLARIWRTRGLGELSTRGWSRPMAALALREARGDWGAWPPEFVDMIWDHLDEGTFRAVLRLYRSAPESELEAAGRGLRGLGAPALVVWGRRDRYLPARFGRDYAEVLDAELMELPGVGHWPWREDAAVIERVVGFLER